MQLEQEVEGEIIYLNKDSKRGLFRQPSGQEMWFDIADDVDAYSIYALFSKRKTTITGNVVQSEPVSAVELNKQVSHAQPQLKNHRMTRVTRNRHFTKHGLFFLILATLLSAKLQAQNFAGFSTDPSAKVEKLTSAGAVLSTGEVLQKLPKPGSRAVRSGLAGPYALSGQYVYLLLDHRPAAGFLDAETGILFVVDAAKVVQLTGEKNGRKSQYYFYRSTNHLSGKFLVTEVK